LAGGDKRFLGTDRAPIPGGVTRSGAVAPTGLAGNRQASGAQKIPDPAVPKIVAYYDNVG
jgi:hypothetical protein